MLGFGFGWRCTLDRRLISGKAKSFQQIAEIKQIIMCFEIQGKLTLSLIVVFQMLFHQTGGHIILALSIWQILKTLELEEVGLQSVYFAYSIKRRGNVIVIEQIDQINWSMYCKKEGKTIKRCSIGHSLPQIAQLVWTGGGHVMPAKSKQAPNWSWNCFLVINVKCKKKVINEKTFIKTNTILIQYFWIKLFSQLKSLSSEVAAKYLSVVWVWKREKRVTKSNGRRTFSRHKHPWFLWFIDGPKLWEIEIKEEVVGKKQIPKKGQKKNHKSHK